MIRVTVFHSNYPQQRELHLFLQQFCQALQMLLFLRCKEQEDLLRITLQPLLHLQVKVIGIGLKRYCKLENRSYNFV